MAPFTFTITPPASPSASLLTYPQHQHFSTRSSRDLLDFEMQLRVDTIHANNCAAQFPLMSPMSPMSAMMSAPSASHHEDDECDPSWTMPHYNVSRAAEVARKLAQEELAIVAPAAAAVLQLGGTIGTPFECEMDHKVVRFAGLYVVNGPTESKHVRYAMEIAVPELQLRTRCIQRFRGFYSLRKRLLKATKRCCHEQLQHQVEAASIHSLKLSALETWRELPLTLRAPRCRPCLYAHKALRAVTFPRRRLFATSAADVRARSFQLETFLGACARLLVEWPGCERGRRLFAAVLGKFLGVDILQQLFPSRYGRGARGGSSSDCECAPSAGPTALSSRSRSSCATAVGGFYADALSSRTQLSGRSSSSSSLSLHEEEEVV